ncbi:MAG: NAD(P)-dependent glycerol-3-phosphate dehydrogenase [Armatimonadetes bacterium]|nr:NAD(P)-dependent glycerol-3-phosphate dehydrogenase [Armatimonadota bacterium]
MPEGAELRSVDGEQTGGGKVAVIGAGAWGTTLAWMLGMKGHEVSLWCRREELAREIEATRRNRAYRPEIELPPAVEATACMDAALQGAAFVILAVPAQVLRPVLEEAAQHLPAEAFLIIAAKGIERATGKRMTQVAADVLGSNVATRCGVLSGPNLSAEIATGRPAATVVAGDGAEWRRTSQVLFASPLFRVYTNCDTIGVELCGAAKNVIAIAAGMSDGLGYGQNAKAMLVTRGLAEMARLVAGCGGDPRTCWGLAGLGDLMVTCHSALSRNWTFGYHLGQGMSVEDAERAVSGVVEGVGTCAALKDLAAPGADLPLTQAVYAIIYDKQAPAEVAKSLMGRRWRDEAETWPQLGGPR